MEFSRYLTFSFLVTFLLLAITKSTVSQGPVFINPNANIPVIPAATNQGNFVIQTVYGFLDFTTTIGNTIMVFSPQSAAAPEPVQPLKDPTSNIIETKPAQPKQEVKIEPSKTQIKSDDKKSSRQSVLTKVEVKSAPITKVNVVEGKSSTAPAVMSKVEVVENTSKKPQPSVITKVEVIGGPPSTPTPIISSKVEIQNRPVVSKVTQIKPDEEPAIIVGNGIGGGNDPEFDFLSRQPSEVVEETYKVINFKPSSKFILKHRPSEAKKNVASKNGGNHPTGLVTKLGGTVVKDGVTTVIETSVIGTYISGKYAQVLQSSSRKINPTQSLRILKTAAPSLAKGSKHHQHRHIEPTPAGAVNEDATTPVENSIKSTRKPSTSGFKRFKNRHKEQEVAVPSQEDSNHNNEQEQGFKKSQKNRNQSSHTRKQHTTTTQKRNRNRKTTTSKPSVRSGEETTTVAPGKRYSSRKNKQTRTSTTESSPGYSRRGYKPKVQPSTVDQVSSVTSSSLYKFKLNRSPGRWQYKTTGKPRVTIRKQNVEETTATNNNSNIVNGNETVASAQTSENLSSESASPQARSDDVDSLEGSESIASIIDEEGDTENNKLDTPAFPIETIKVEISTPPDFTEVYYEIATIKSPYTFQVGSVKNTRYVTVTSTFEKSFESTLDPTPTKVVEPLTENILATSSNYAKDNNFLDSSIATLPPLYLASDMETPPLETMTETFSTTQTMLKTHILPVVRFANETATSTLVQTYLVTRLVTATKTLPPMDAYQFIPSKVLNEFNSHLDEAGSELHLELEFGDSNEQEDGQIRKVSLPADLDLAKIGSNFDLADVDKTKILEAHLRPKKNQTPKPSVNDFQNQQLTPDQLQQLALYKLLNPAAPGQGQVITTSKPVLKIQTLYETFVLPVTQGHNTIQSTISKIKGTITKTDYEFGTSTIPPVLPIQPIQQIPQIPQIPQLQPQLPQLNPFVPQPQFALTSSPIVQSTMVTQTNSKVLKLTFGAKTAHTTIYSTTVVPSLVTSYITASVPVAPTAAPYPGYFPPPYPAYPFVG